MQLHVVPAEAEPFDTPLEGDSLVIGRSSGCSVVIADRFLSRQHARLVRDDQGWLLEDLGSRNGTLLNGELVAKPTRVALGDVIKLSGSVVTLQEKPAGGGVHVSDRPPSFLDHTIFRPATELLESASPSSSHAITGEVALRRYAERLRLLAEVHQALARPISRADLLELILDRVFHHLGPEQAVIFLKDAEGELEQVATRSTGGSTSEILASRSLAREVIEKGLAALVLDVLTDERFAAAQSMLTSGVRSLVAAPLLTDEGCPGMIVLSSKAAKRQFSEEDLELLVALAAAAALRIRNLSLTEEAVKHARLEEELALARRIQVALLPDRLPELPGWELYGTNFPSRWISGDYWEVVHRQRDGRCVLMVADVSGKGIAAALLTATLEALSATPIEDAVPPEEMFGRLSRLLYLRTPPEKYATAFLAELDPESGALRYANAGHNAGLVIRADGAVEKLTSTGRPLGLLPSGDYEPAEVTLSAGDTLVLYTDGITEAVDPDDEEYGIDRLAAACQSFGTPIDQLAAALLADVDAFAKGVPYADDRTLVLLRRSAA